MAAPDVQPDFSPAGLIKSDPITAGEVNLKWTTLASDQAIARAEKALIANFHKVSVVESSSVALGLLKTLTPAGSTVSNGGSQTLEQIGWVDYIKNNKDVRYIKSEANALIATGDFSGYLAKLREGASADVFLASVVAVTESGEIYTVDASGSRLHGISGAAKSVVLVLGSQKVVPTAEDAELRLHQWQHPLESARARIAYKVPASTVNNEVWIKAGNPYLKDRIHVVIVKEPLGY